MNFVLQPDPLGAGRLVLPAAIRFFWAALLLAPLLAAAASRASANFSLLAEILDAGGGSMQSANYSADPVSVGGLEAGTSSSAHYTLQPGFVASALDDVPCPTVTPSPATLGDGVVGLPYSQAITASGGTAPYTFALTASELPAGLNLSNSGILSGTPTAAGTATFTVEATDSQGCSGTRIYLLTIYRFCLQDDTDPGTILKFDI